MMQKAMILSAALAAVASPGANAQGSRKVTECVCTAACSIWGDPHVTMFDTTDYIEESEEFTIYKVGRFEITGSSFGGRNFWLGTLDFNGKKYDKDDCESEETFWTDDYEFRDGGSVAVEIRCVLRNSVFHLDVDLSKVNIGDTPEWTAMEDAAGASGVCRYGSSDASVNPARVLRGSNELASKFENNVRKLGQRKVITCECESSCELFGDPHVRSFNDNEEIFMDDGELLIYSEGSFKIIAENQFTRVKVLKFGDETYPADEICRTRSDEFTWTHTWRNGNRIVANAKCASIRNTPGFYFNIAFTKYDTVEEGDGQDFRSIESGLRTTGACITV